ncbi:hypothetical protein ACTWP5_00365 [Streptomyces sp. 4N509B]|uniref:hypothetical protein n=1 Tax=Streptomyces sp. 4N509B TaxID=3457413 RepID=UPI003FD351A2
MTRTTQHSTRPHHTSRRLPRTAGRGLALVGATLLGLALTGPAAATAHGDADREVAVSAGNVESDRDRVAQDGTSSLLSISPSSGGAGSTVTITAACQPSSPARSDALQESVSLRESNGVWTGTGTIRTSGLAVGSTYQFTVVCADGSTISAPFTFTAATPTGGASAGFGGQSTGAAGTSGSTQATALAVGGGVAAVGAAAYVFLSRRRRSGNHSY